MESSAESWKIAMDKVLFGGESPHILPKILKHLDLGSLTSVWAAFKPWQDYAEDAIKCRASLDKMGSSEYKDRMGRFLGDGIALEPVEHDDNGSSEGHKSNNVDSKALFRMVQKHGHDTPRDAWKTTCYCSALIIEGSTPLILWMLLQNTNWNLLKHLSLRKTLSVSDWNHGLGQLLLSELRSLNTLCVVLLQKAKSGSTDFIRQTTCRENVQLPPNTSIQYLLVECPIVVYQGSFQPRKPLVEVAFVPGLCPNLKWFRQKLVCREVFQNHKDLFQSLGVVQLDFDLLKVKKLKFSVKPSTKRKQVPSLMRLRTAEAKQVIETELKYFAQLFPYEALRMDVTTGIEEIAAMLPGNGRKLKSLEIRFIIPSSLAYQEAVEAVRKWRLDSDFSDLSKLSFWFPETEEHWWTRKTYQMIQQPIEASEEAVGLINVTEVGAFYGPVRSHEDVRCRIDGELVEAYWKYLLELMPSVRIVTSNASGLRMSSITRLIPKPKYLSFYRYLNTVEEFIRAIPDVLDHGAFDYGIETSMRFYMLEGVNPAPELDLRRIVRHANAVINELQNERLNADLFDQLPNFADEDE